MIVRNYVYFTPFFCVCIYFWYICFAFRDRVFVVKSHEKFMKNSHSHTGNMERTPFDCISSIFEEKCINIYTGVYYCYIYGANKNGKGLVSLKVKSFTTRFVFIVFVLYSYNYDGTLWEFFVYETLSYFSRMS